MDHTQYDQPLATAASNELVPHTPGPWAVHPITAQVDAFATGEPVPICRLLWPTDVRSEDETEANGHLIAAAPGLLAALKDCLDQLVMYEERGWLGMAWRTRIGLPDDIAAARAAIAKAEGR